MPTTARRTAAPDRSAHDARHRRLSRGDYIRLLSDMEQAAGPAMHSAQPGNRRQQLRTPYLAHASLILEPDAGPQQTEPLDLRCRNVSRRGLSFLHPVALPVGQRCRIELPGLQAAGLTMTGVITRCRAVTREAFEIGVQFDRSLDLARLSQRRIGL